MKQAERDKKPSVSVLIKTLVLLIVTFSGLLSYSHYWQKTNPNIDALRQKIATFERDAEKPLVIVLGASLEMLATPSTWNNTVFDWLRLVLQGARIDEFDAVVDDVIRAQPDLILIGMHLLVAEELDESLRAAVKPLLRAPLVHAGLVPRLSRRESSTCGIGKTDLPTAMDRVAIQFKNSRNDFDSSSVINTLTATDIPVVILRTNMVQEIEQYSDIRNTWIENFMRDSAHNVIPVLAFKQALDKSHFCPDWLHMSKKGMAVFSPWLKQALLTRLDRE